MPHHIPQTFYIPQTFSQFCCLKVKQFQYWSGWQLMAISLLVLLKYCSFARCIGSFVCIYLSCLHLSGQIFKTWKKKPKKNWKHMRAVCKMPEKATAANPSRQRPAKSRLPEKRMPALFVRSAGRKVGTVLAKTAMLMVQDLRQGPPASVRRVAALQDDCPAQFISLAETLV